jgi:hypothetical protein
MRPCRRRWVRGRNVSVQPTSKDEGDAKGG